MLEMRTITPIMIAPSIEVVFFPPLALWPRIPALFSLGFAARSSIASAGGDAPASPAIAMRGDVPLEALASKKPKAKSATPRKRRSKQPALSCRGSVLVVDDVPDVTEMIQLLLKHAGYDVATAESALAALNLARKNHYDLVISDIGMPEMNGYELASALRELAAYNKTPLIAVTGYTEYDDRGRAVEAGFNVHLTKPIEPAQLLTLMSELLPQSEH
jgi:CheY-like chemotaxis protein